MARLFRHKTTIFGWRRGGGGGGGGGGGVNTVYNHGEFFALLYIVYTACACASYKPHLFFWVRGGSVCKDDFRAPRVTGRDVGRTNGQ